MGTRSLTHVREKEGSNSPETLVTIYRQMNGYPSCHGLELADFLVNRKVGNGISLGDVEIKFSNGPGDLAAQLVHALKSESPVGGIYITKPGESDCGEEYTYTITVRDYKLLRYNVDVEVKSGYGSSMEVEFSGNAAAFVDWVHKVVASELEEWART